MMVMVIIAGVVASVGGCAKVAIIAMANDAPIATATVTAGGVAVSNITFIYVCRTPIALCFFQKT